MDITVERFNYDSADTAAAQTLRDAAGAIQKIQHTAIADIGRWLVTAKKLLDHGQFAAWAATELGMERRTTQRAMLAAQFLEGKCVTVTHLPPGIIYRLSAPSAPAAVVDAVVAASETDAPMSSKEITKRLAAARQEEKEIKQEITRIKTALTKEEARERRISPVIEKFAKALTDENLVDLVDIMNDYMPGRLFIVAILNAEQNSRIKGKPDPTDWKNKVDYCLAHTAGLTGRQQDIVAALGGVATPTAEQLDRLEHIYNTSRRCQEPAR